MNVEGYGRSQSCGWLKPVLSQRFLGQREEEQNSEFLDVYQVTVLLIYATNKCWLVIICY